MATGIPIPENVVALIRTYIGLLIGNNDLSVYTNQKVTYSMLPESMVDERNILKAIDECLKEGVPPQKEYIEAKLLVNNLQVTPNAVTAMADAVGSEWKASIHNSLRLAGSVIHQWHFETDGINSWSRASQIMEDKTLGDYQTRYEKARKIITRSSPLVDSLVIKPDLELIRDGMAEYDRKYEIMKSKGKFPNPVPHLASLRMMGISFFDGEYSLLLGDEGTGKSSFAQQLAENIAWEQGLGYDVAYISLETNREKLAYRTLARQLGIPLDDFVNFRVDTKSSEYLEVYKAFLERRTMSEENSGAVLYVTVGDKSSNGIIDAINQCHFITTSAGRKLFVIVDHVGRIEKIRSSGVNDATATTESVVNIANACNAINSHVMFLGHTTNNGDGKLFGASQVNKNSQTVLVLKAEAVEGGVQFDMPATNMLGKKMADYLGRPRFFQRKGNKHSAEATIVIEKSNDSSGGSVKVLVERPMGNIFVDMQSELERLKGLR